MWETDKREQEGSKGRQGGEDTTVILFILGI